MLRRRQLEQLGQLFGKALRLTANQKVVQVVLVVFSLSHVNGHDCSYACGASQSGSGKQLERIGKNLSQKLEKIFF